MWASAILTESEADSIDPELHVHGQQYETIRATRKASTP
jgi:hypothetical protein